MIDVNNENIKNATKIAVSLSGGADSAILFYHACDVLSDRTFIPWSGYDTRRPDSIFYAIEVYSFIKKSYPNVNILPLHKFEYTTVPGQFQNTKEWSWQKDPKSVAHHNEEIKLWKKHNYTITLNGMTSNPPDEAIKEYKMDVDTGHGVIEPRRSVRDRPHWLHHTHFRGVYSPFVQEDKSYVKMMYEKYGVLNTLFPLTASCIGFPYETDNGQKPCRNCVWCKERLWAFGEEHLQ